MDKKIILIIISTMALQACNKQLDAFVDGVAGKSTPRSVARTDTEYSMQLQANTKRIAQLEVGDSGLAEVDAMIKKAEEKSSFSLKSSERADLEKFESEANKYKRAVNKIKQDEYSNHKYCLAGICIGDTLAKVSKQHWFKIDKEFKDNAIKHRRYNKSRYKGSKKTLSALAPYIMLKKFDDFALKQMANLDAVCEPIYLDGGFYTKSKYWVDVTLSATLKADGTHEFQVTMIKEDFRGLTADSKPEIKAIRAKLASIFPGVGTEGRVKNNWVQFNGSPGAMESVSVTIRDPDGYYKGNSSISDALMKNPKCQVSVSLD